MNDKVNKKVLLVDDEYRLLASYKKQLRGKFEVVSALNGEEAIFILKEHGPFAVVVSDYRMPGMDGIEFLVQARQVAPETSRIILTGYADLQAVIDAVNRGNIFRFLTRPCSAKDLIEAITMGVNQYQLITAQQKMLKDALCQVHKEKAERKRAEMQVQKVLTELNNTMEAVVRAMALAVEKRDPYTAEHQRRVARLARAIAWELGFSEEEVKGVYMAAAIHDIGKLYVPVEILNKPGVLSKIEFTLVKEHPKVGYEILKPLNFVWPIASIILQHHERLDGSGYPNGLTGDDILPQAKILGVADVVEAISSHRPYRPALGVKKALEEISQKRGVLYEEDVVDACLKLFDSMNFNFYP